MFACIWDSVPFCIYSIYELDLNLLHGDFEQHIYPYRSEHIYKRFNLAYYERKTRKRAEQVFSIHEPSLPTTPTLDSSRHPRSRPPSPRNAKLPPNPKPPASYISFVSNIPFLQNGWILSVVKSGLTVVIGRAISEGHKSALRVW